MSNPGRSEYNGPRRKLVLAFDVGTTFSGISYCVLDPGQVPEVTGVTRYPAQGNVSGAAKIPTVIYYDPQGQVRAAGAEAICEGIEETAEEEHWVKAEWFKLHLRPKIASGRDVSGDIHPLPLNKTVVEVMADYLKYLFGCAAIFIQEMHVNGVNIWNSVKNKIDYVLSHPNGWEGAQQSDMRRAAVLAGLVIDNPSGHACLSFVSEGEASLNLQVIRPTNHVNKAVSDGAISFYLDHFVQTRVSKHVYGTDCRIRYDPSNPEHQKRSRDLVMACDGSKRIDGGFDTILNKNVPVLETTEFRRSYARRSRAKESFSFSDPILCYRGTLVNPKWKDNDGDKCTVLCTISIDLSHLPLPVVDDGLFKYFELRYDIVLLFGLTELKAQIVWKENGIEKRTTPKIVYDPDY